MTAASEREKECDPPCLYHCSSRDSNCSPKLVLPRCTLGEFPILGVGGKDLYTVNTPEGIFRLGAKTLVRVGLLDKRQALCGLI